MSTKNAKVQIRNHVLLLILAVLLTVGMFTVAYVVPEQAIAPLTMMIFIGFFFVGWEVGEIWRARDMMRGKVS